MPRMATVYYHRDVYGFPADLRRPEPGHDVCYTKHALLAAADDGFKPHQLPPRLPAQFELVEARTFAGRVFAWVVRFPIMRVVKGAAEPTGWDFVFTLGFNYDVVTVFVNKADDQHETLNTERYSMPERIA